MPTSYTYNGSEERYYPELGVLAVPGESQTLGRKPDDDWVATSSTKKTSPAPKAADAPDDATPDAAPAPVADTTTTKA